MPRRGLAPRPPRRARDAEAPDRRDPVVRMPIAAMTDPMPPAGGPVQGALRPAPSPRPTTARRASRASSGLTARRAPRAGSPSAGEPAFRARQVMDAVWGTGARLARRDSRRCRRRLQGGARGGVPVRHGRRHELRFADGGLTEKALHRLRDGLLIESVLMHYPARAATPRAAHAVHLVARPAARSAARSARPASWASERDLETAEIVDQVRTPARRLARRRQAPHQRRVHGHGRAAAQPRPRARGDRGAQRPAPVRARRAAHHGLDVRRRARHPAADRARAAVHARRLAPRRAQRAARRARAAQPALAGRGGRRRGPRARAGDRPPGDLRGRR